jgi:hypothetical protein
MKNTTFNVLALALLFSLGAVSSLLADSVSLNFDSGSVTLNNVGNLTALPSGDALEFGYYTGATNSSNLFSGTFVALTGFSGVNSGLAFTQIGQETSNGAGPGQFAFAASNITFTTGSPITGVDLPNAGQILAVQFYNAANPSNATFYGAASDTLWTWTAPASPAPAPMIYSLDNPGVTYLNGDAFTGTTTLVPEPGTTALLGLGLGALGLLRLRRRKLAFA